MKVNQCIKDSAVELARVRFSRNILMKQIYEFVDTILKI